MKNNNQALVSISGKRGFFSKIGDFFKNLFSKDKLVNNEIVDQRKLAISDFSLLSKILKNEVSVLSLSENEAKRLCTLCEKRLDIIDSKLEDKKKNYDLVESQINKIKNIYQKNNMDDTI